MADWYVYGVFLIAVFAGAWVQATSGFALGIIVMAVVQLTGIMSLAQAAAAISVLAMLNIGMSLIDAYKHIDKRLFWFLTLGQIPAIAVGIELLNYLGREATVVLELVFGLFVVLGSLSLAFNPTPQERVSSRSATIAAGVAGGLFGGMFAASGPVVGWFAYRQPLIISAVRASLLAMLGATTITRTVIVSIDGIFDQALLVMIAAAVPVVFIATFVARRYPPTVTDRQFRRSIFFMMFLVGCWITTGATMKLLSTT